MAIIIDGNNGITDVNGSASTPAITGLDNDTGVYFGTNLLGLSTAGTNALYIDSSQNVGIGTTTPGGKLDITKATNGSAFVVNAPGGSNPNFIVSGSGEQTFRLYNTASTGSTRTSIKLASRSNTDWEWIVFTDSLGTGVNDLTFSNLSGSPFYISAAGNVGINTSSPSQKLMVAGNILVGDGYQMISSGTGGSASAPTYTWGGQAAKTGMYLPADSTIAFTTAAAERMRIDSSGNVGIGASPETTTQRLYILGNKTSEGTSSNDSFIKLSGASGVSQAQFMRIDSGNYSATACGFSIGRNSSNLRSINAGGTVNASGADYAEYMTKSGDFTIAKGDIAGIDSNGKLTNIFENAISFVVKSTDPSYVGGDAWGVDLEGEELESARMLVDRIAFAGQVPVNVFGASAGQYIIPINDNGSIKGESVSNPTFEQYQIAVGKVIAIEADGRAKIIVKVA